jgi:starch-binding outer membrane protein, SusD/RagB family
MTSIMTQIQAAKRFRRLAVAAATITSLAGCDTLTKVSTPDIRQPADFAGAAGASALAIGGITSFVRAFGGGGVSQVTIAGAIGDELFATGFNLGERDWDGRSTTDPAPTEGGAYNAISLARGNMLVAISSLKRAAPDSNARIGQLFALTGYTEVFFGENYCAGVPLSSIDDDFAPIYGTPLTSQQMYERAIADFDSALKRTVDSVRYLNLARVGKGRALLDLGRFNDAAAAVAPVPTTYLYNVNFVANSNTNFNTAFTSATYNFYTIPEREGGNGINWRTAQDPRVPLVNRSPALRGLDLSDVYQYARYQSTTAPITLASGIEARLIEAEAALQAGNTTQWLATLNTLRATAITPAMAALTDPGSTPTRVDLHFRERAFWLFLTGHRQGDLRRLIRQYGRNAETVFPTGLWRDGQPYGPATNVALPGTENNNPNYKACLDRNA